MGGRRFCAAFAWIGACVHNGDETGFKEKPEKSKRFFREGKAGQWHEGLTRRQVRRIVQDHHVQMARFGYLTEELKGLV